MNSIDFYWCAHCGKIIAIVKASGVPTVCCGVPMQHLDPNTVDGSVEKHVPYIQAKGNVVTVSVGKEEHPSVENHFIEWIVLLTTRGLHARSIRPGERPRAQFTLQDNEDIRASYAYCNLHKLWKRDWNISA